MDKVLGGTPPSCGSLCDSCRNALTIQGVNFEKIVICQASPHGLRLNFPVYKCSIYDDKRLPALSGMKEIAWEVKSRKRDPVGFARGDAELEVKITPPNEWRGVPQESPVADESKKDSR